MANRIMWTDEQGKLHTGYGEGVKMVAEYPYFDEKGNYMYSKLRFEGGNIKKKEMRIYYIDRKNDRYDKVDTPKQSLYNLRNFLKYRKKTKAVYLVEGEKDVDTLKELGNKQNEPEVVKQIGKEFRCVVTAGGADSWNSCYAKLFKGCNVIILRDNDEPGNKLAKKEAKDLKRYAHSVKIVKPSQLDHGDVTDYLTKEGGNAQTLRELCENAEAEYTEYAPWIVRSDKGRSFVNTSILAEVFSENEDYLIVRNPTDNNDIFYFYEDGVYKQLNKSGVKARIREYISPALVTDSALNNIYNLILATNNHIHSIAELDSDGRYINFRSGLLNIAEGKLEEHSPFIFSTIQLPFDYDPSDKLCPVFMKYIRDLCSDDDGVVDEEKIKTIQEYIGFILSNEPMSKIKTALVLWSRQGNSGKSVLIRLVTYIFGYDRVASIKLKELVAENRFILGTLPACRMIACGDESNSSINDISIFNSLTGGDPVKIELKGKQGVTYIYKGGFIIACNGLPCFADDKGDHLFNRILIVPCEHHITDEMKDDQLDEKLHKEIPGIINWALEGFKRLRENKFVFTKSEASQISKEEYRKQMDNVYRFAAENYIITHKYSDRISKTEFEDAYERWTICDQSIKAVERKNLAARLEAIGIHCGTGNIGTRHNIAVLRGIKDKTASDDYEQEELDLEQEEPF